jgi:hypothetical protein
LSQTDYMDDLADAFTNQRSRSRPRKRSGRVRLE